MTLTPIQIASLNRLKQYQAMPPRLRDRLRLSAAYMLVLLLPMLMSSFSVRPGAATV